MVYKHQYFKLDTEKKKLFDYHGEETFISGTSKVFKLLEFLCEKYPTSVTITNINDHIDPLEEDREITEDYVRNMRNEVKKALHHDLVEYKNHVYSIIGNIEKFEKEPENKDLPVQGQNIILAIKKSNKIKIATIIIVIALLIIVGYVWIRYRNGGIGFSAKPNNDMVLIPSGNFLMGSTEQQIKSAFEMCKSEEGNYCVFEDYAAEYPQHSVMLKSFYIDRKEVSNADYQLFIKATKHESLPTRYASDNSLNGNNLPVVGATWNDAVAYCVWVGKRLPTEEEWERTARGTDGRIWTWGNAWDTKASNHGTGGIPGLDNSDGYDYSAPVGTTIDLSPEGVLNMAGNVAEWVNAGFEPYSGNDRYNNSEFKLGNKVVRGGAYYSSLADVRAAFRDYMEPETRDTGVGFRCAKDAK